MATELNDENLAPPPIGGAFWRDVFLRALTAKRTAEEAADIADEAVGMSAGRLATYKRPEPKIDARLADYYRAGDWPLRFLVRAAKVRNVYPLEFDMALAQAETHLQAHPCRQQSYETPQPLGAPLDAAEHTEMLELLLRNLVAAGRGLPVGRSNFDKQMDAAIRYLESRA